MSETRNEQNHIARQKAAAEHGPWNYPELTGWKPEHGTDIPKEKWAAMAGIGADTKKPAAAPNQPAPVTTTAPAKQAAPSPPPTAAPDPVKAAGPQSVAGPPVSDK